MLSLFFGFWEQWLNPQKVTFDGQNRLILINNGITYLDVKTDLYSDWKEWAALIENSHWPQALRSVGGDPTVEGKYLGATFFLMNGWKVKTWEGDHRLIVNGNLYAEDGSNVFVPTQGDYTVEINMTTSNIVDALQPDLSGINFFNAAEDYVRLDPSIPVQVDPATIVNLDSSYDAAKTALQIEDLENSSILNFIRKILTNQSIDNGEIIEIYDDDGTTLLGTFTWDGVTGTRGAFA